MAGFTKKDDLKFFLKKICNIDYVHLPELAPTKEILDNYKKHKGSWSDYEHKFLTLIADRRVETTIPKDILTDGCLLCSEQKPDYCHRRLVAEYLSKKWENIDIEHL